MKTAPRPRLRCAIAVAGLIALGVAGLIALGVGGPALAAASGVPHESSVADLLTGAKVKLNLRYRYEFVSDDLTPLDANASTLRTRLGLLSGKYRGIQGFVEMENISSILSEKYNAPGPFGPKRPGRAIVADPQLTELNQAWGQFTGPGNTVIRGGRQRVILDNARFIGNVGWRQNEQTYDAVTVKSEFIPDTTVYYGYFFNANTILGSDRGMKSHIFNASYKGLSWGTLTGYAYLLDFDPGVGTDSRTLGFRFAGAHKLGGGLKLLYTAEYADQSDYRDSAGFNTQYFKFEAGLTVSGITAKGGIEVLGSDHGATAFATPLATLHAFNGWTDRFLATPATGIEDVYGVITTTLGSVKLLAVYHDFSSEDGGISYGNEIDLLATRKFGKYVSAGAKFGHYNAGNPGAGPVNNDVDKLWLWLGVNY